jgi:hypothetical protein
MYTNQTILYAKQVERLKIAKWTQPQAADSEPRASASGRLRFFSAAV